MDKVNLAQKFSLFQECTDPVRLDTKCVVVSSSRVDLTAPASIGFQTQLE
jgi:hypothetical protein